MLDWDNVKEIKVGQCKFASFRWTLLCGSLIPAYAGLPVPADWAYKIGHSNCFKGDCVNSDEQKVFIGIIFPHMFSYIQLSITY